MINNLKSKAWIDIAENLKKPFQDLPRFWWWVYFVFLGLCVIPFIENGTTNSLDKNISASIYGKPELRSAYAVFLTNFGDYDTVKYSCWFLAILFVILNRWRYLPALLGVFGCMELTWFLRRNLARPRPSYPDIPPIGAYGFPVTTQDVLTP